MWEMTLCPAVSVQPRFNAPCNLCGCSYVRLTDNVYVIPPGAIQIPGGDIISRYSHGRTVATTVGREVRRFGLHLSLKSLKSLSGQNCTISGIPYLTGIEIVVIVR